MAKKIAGTLLPKMFAVFIFLSHPCVFGSDFSEIKEKYRVNFWGSNWLLGEDNGEYTLFSFNKNNEVVAMREIRSTDKKEFGKVRSLISRNKAFRLEGYLKERFPSYIIDTAKSERNLAICERILNLKPSKASKSYSKLDTEIPSENRTVSMSSLVGLAKDEVITILGAPDYDDGDLIKYGINKIVRFKSDCVSSYDGFSLSEIQNLVKNYRKGAKSGSKPQEATASLSGLSKESVKEILGLPVSEDSICFRYSDGKLVRFDRAGKVTACEGFHPVIPLSKYETLKTKDTSCNPTARQLELAGLASFIGLTKSEVITILGIPDHEDDDAEFIKYGIDKIVRFESNCVFSYDGFQPSEVDRLVQNFRNLKKSGNQPTQPTASLSGLSKKDVREILGLPKSEDDLCFRYGKGEIVRFDRTGKVTACEGFHPVIPLSKYEMLKKKDVFCNSTNQQVVAPSGLIIRSQPSRTGKSLGKVGMGEQVELSTKIGPEETIEGKREHWVYVRAKGIEGWVFKGFLEDAKSATTNVAASTPSSYSPSYSNPYSNSYTTDEKRALLREAIIEKCQQETGCSRYEADTALRGKDIDPFSTNMSDEQADAYFNKLRPK